MKGHTITDLASGIHQDVTDHPDTGMYMEE